MNTKTEQKEKIFEKPVKIILILVTIVTIGLIIEAFINNHNAKEIRKNYFNIESEKWFSQ